MTIKGHEADITVRLPVGRAARRISNAIDRTVERLARHWLAVFNGIAAVFVGLPLLAPVLMHVGLDRLGRLIYLLYSPTCHQLPERSYFLFGQQPVYSVIQLEAVGAVPGGLNLFQRELMRYVGSEQMGYKVAFCERDLAIYGSILLGGLLFGLLRRRYLESGVRIPKLSFSGYGLMLLPMAIDGLTQLLGWRESTWALRSLTGMLFGLASVWLEYPYIQEAMDDVQAVPPRGTSGDAT